MHRSETEQLIDCLACGAEVSLDRDRAYPVSENSGLCFVCAIKRGGEYDELHDHWTKPPNISDLGSRMREI